MQTDYKQLIEELRLKMRAQHKRPLPDDDDAAAEQLAARMLRELALTPVDKTKLRVYVHQLIAAQI